MRSILSQVHHLFLLVWKGCGYLEGFGHHPGTENMVLLLVLGMIVGSEGGAKGVLAGLVIMGITFGPFYLFSAYDRAKKSNLIKE